ncbi:PREDICTED: lipid phosphate phosphatase epsilon 2, chloroplastic-like [Nelumbo nucifera]|uniref:Lipid phosphate phosphatase epsilon 2, chloroplastic-like n=1 Tax=Nelumbo nucifera TaxID=4432 RepID=A0A1U8ADM8_NELNU|nr:PREDICTED: lipid phosphate phosphatase epsilon 2, chloroplastic-like [Nelumbo nucifera]
MYSQCKDYGGEISPKCYSRFSPVLPRSSPQFSLSVHLCRKMPVSAIPFRPVPPYFPCRPCSKSFSLVQFSSAKPFHFVGFFHRRGPRIMTDLVNTSAFRSNDGDEGFFSVEKEAILGNELSEFRSNFISGGFEATLNRLSKWLVFALFGAFILLRHDIEALWAAMGSVINAWLSITIKRILNQERPVSTLRSGPGMPSSHAQTIFFAVIFAILSLVEWLGINGFTIIAGVFVLACGSYFSWLRVSQQLHTLSQVIVGAVLGSIFSILWFWSWNAIVLKAFISSLWVRVLVVLGATGCCVAFLLYVIRNWLMDEE